MVLATLAAILDTARVTSGAPGVYAPVEVGKLGVGSERFAAGRPCVLQIMRDRDGTAAALDGTIAVHGANIPHPDTGAPSKVQVFRGKDGASNLTFDMTADMPYVAFSNNNFAVRVNGTWFTRKASPGASQFDVSNPSGTVARITLGVAAADADRVEVFFLTPTQILADGNHENELVEITSKSLLWVLPTYASSNLSRTVAVLRPGTG